MLFGIEAICYEEFNVIRLRKGDLEAKKAAYEKKIDRLDDFTRVLGRALEDDLLPDHIFYPLEAAYERLCRMQRWLEDGIDVLQEAIDAWGVLEDSINFVYEDVPKQVPRLT